MRRLRLGLPNRKAACTSVFQCAGCFWCFQTFPLRKTNMLEIIFMLLVVAVPLLHLYTFFTEAGHLDQWEPWLVIVMLVLTGTWFIYFVSPSARRKLGI